LTDTDTIASDNDPNGDDINDVPDSRTFLALVSSRGTSIHWLELGTVLDTADAAPSPPPLATAIMNNGYQVYGNPVASQFTTPPTFDLAQNHSLFNAAAAAAAAAAAVTTMNNNYSAQQQQHGLQQRQQLFFQQQLMAAPVTVAPPAPPLFQPTWHLPTRFCFSPADVTATSGDALTAAQLQHMQQLQQDRRGESASGRCPDRDAAAPARDAVFVSANNWNDAQSHHGGAAACNDNTHRVASTATTTTAASLFSILQWGFRKRTGQQWPVPYQLPNSSHGLHLRE
jgi:hypothetical protein